MLHVHRSERADALVEPLARLLADPSTDPFAPEVVAVPTRGVERWVAQRLSHRLGAGPDGEAGVCANVTFAPPTRLVGDVLGATLGLDADNDPWHAERLVWPLLEVVDACAGEAWCAALGRHLGVRDRTAPDGGDHEGTGDVGDQRRGRRLAVARHLADLFASYGSQRPDLVRAWADGRDEDGGGLALPADLAWQAELWRRLRGHVGVPSPPERLDHALATLVTDPGVAALPERLSVFGLTRLPEDQLRVLVALAAHREVHLWLLHPSPALWARCAQGPAGGVATSRRRSDHPSPAEHPLLASMARDATELQLRLAALSVEPGGAAAGAAGSSEHHHPAPDPPPTLLGALQRRLREDDGDGSRGACDLAPDDRSVQVHACHGRARQVEVLREVLVGLFADDPTLEPRDVLVMCPDIESFAPLVAATFGLALHEGDAASGTPAGATDVVRGMEGSGRRDADDVHPGQRLRVRLADRSLRRTNPLLETLSRLLELADGRVTAGEVLDLAATEPVRRRFRLDDDDLDRIRGWAMEGGVRWGEDRARRARFGLDHVGQGTWEAALDRVLLGAAMAEEDQRYVGPALPLDDVDSTDIDLAGRLAELLDRLTSALAGLCGVRPLTDWLDALDRALDLLTDTTPGDAWQGVQARAVLAVVRAAGERDRAGGPPRTPAVEPLPLRLPDVRALLAGRLEGRPTRAGFRTGALTMCSLVPMRSVPHRVVALLGMDDGAFPRVAASDGDDVLLRNPLLGERDRRSEDRQLFLDAVTAAREHLVVLYSGADERTGARRPPAVPVGELLDALDAAAAPGDAAVPGEGSVRRRVLVRHPLQTVAERNFASGALGRAGPFSFDRASHAAAVVGREPRAAATLFLPRPLPPHVHRDEVDLDDLVAALEHPVRTFVRHRLGVSPVADSDDVDDRLPLQLDPLDAWQVGDRLLAAHRAGADLAVAARAERRRGQVPPGALGTRALAEVIERVDPIAAAAAAHRLETAAAVDVSVDLPDGRTLVGTVPGVYSDVVLRAVYSRLGAKHRVRAWAQVLALVASDPGRTRRAVTIGRGSGRRPSARVAEIDPPDGPVALQRLVELVTLRDRALREPLPLPVGTSAAYAHGRSAGDAEVQALDAARKEWSGGFEAGDAYHVTVWGEAASLEDLLGTPTRTEQAWWPEESTRLGVLARRVWDPLLDHERSATA